MNARTRPSRWAELDAMVGEEVDAIAKRPAGGPTPVDAETAERLFMEQAEAFLATHPEPQRLIGRLQARFAPEAPRPEQGEGP